MKPWSLCSVVLLFVLAATAICTPAMGEPALKALVVTGQNNHNWQVSSPILKQVLEDTGLFTVGMATSPPEGADMASFKPDFAAYDVVVLDYTGDAWPGDTQTAFEAYVKGGGGVVVFHAANNAFPEWLEFNKIIGLGGWGGRSEKDGPYVRWRDGEIVHDMKPGSGGTHGTQHAFQMHTREKNHPIMKGLPEAWMHAKDELYALLRGPAENLTVLATAFSAPKEKGTGEHEPMLFTVDYGKGRCFHTALGHASDPSPPAMQCVGFIVTLQRGAEWAATGKVTQPIPDDFPTAEEVRLWKNFRPASVAGSLDFVRTYKYGQSLAPLVELDGLIRSATSRGADLGPVEDALLTVLQANPTPDGRLYACKKLAAVGTRASIPLLTEMLANEESASAARYALERIPDARAGAALRDALDTTRGETRIGVIGSLGARGENEAVPLLAKYLTERDTATTKAAASALGRIGGTDAAEILTEKKNRVSREARSVVLDALLSCAQEMADGRKTRQALGIYDDLFATEKSTPVLVAALRGRVACSETKAGEAITEALQGGDPALCAAAIGVLPTIESSRVIETVAESLPGLAPGIQVALMEALAKKGDPAAMDAIAAAANSDAPPLRLAALRALGKLGDDSLVLMLAERAAKTPNEEGEAARASLHALRAESVDAAIVREIGRNEPPLKNELILAVAARKIATGAKTLLEAAVHPDEGVRVLALVALRVVAEPDVLPDLVDIAANATGDQDLQEAAETVAVVARKMPEADGRATLVVQQLAEVTDPAIRRSLLRVLGKIGDPSGLPPLYEALHSGDMLLRGAAIDALGDWPDAAPCGELLQVAEAFAGEPHASQALDAYVKLAALESGRPGAETVALLERALRAAMKSSVRQRILTAMASTQDKAALTALEAALGDEDADIRATGIRLLSDWPDDKPLEALLELAEITMNPRHRALALRGVIGLIGKGSGRSAEEATTLYEKVLSLATSPEDQKMVLSGLASTGNIAALRLAASYLADETLREEAEVAVAKIGALVAGSYPTETKQILTTLLGQSQIEFVMKQARETVANIEKFEDYLTAWKVAGPYTKAGAGAEKLFDIIFQPERKGTDDVRWRIIPAGTMTAHPYMIELNKVLEGNDRVAYLRSYIWSNEAQDALLELGSDDGIKVRLNGKVIHANNTIRPGGPNQDRAKTTLKEGWNTLLMKITQGGGEWVACARLRAPDGSKLEGWRAAAEKD